MTRDEYATWVYYFGDRRQTKEAAADQVPDVLAALQNSEWAQKASYDLPIAGAVSALLEIYPMREHGWKTAFRPLMRRVSIAVGMRRDCPEWVDYFLARWFITRDLDAVDAVLDLVANNDELSASAAAKLQQLAGESTAFQKALRAAKDARAAAMVIQ